MKRLINFMMEDYRLTMN